MIEMFLVALRARKEWRTEPQFNSFLQKLDVGGTNWNSLRAYLGVPKNAPIPEATWVKWMDDLVEQYMKTPPYQVYIKAIAFEAEKTVLKPQIEAAKQLVQEKTDAYAQKYSDNSTKELVIKEIDENAMPVAVANNDTALIKRYNDKKATMQKELETGEPEEEQLRTEKEKAERDLLFLQMRTTPRYWGLTDFDPAFGVWLKSDKLVAPIFDTSEDLLLNQMADEYYEQYRGKSTMPNSLRTRMKLGVMELGMNQVHPNWREWTGAREKAWQNTLIAVFDAEGIKYGVNNMAKFIKAVTPDPTWNQIIEQSRWEIVKAKKAARRRAFYSVAIIVAIIVVIIVTIGTAAPTVTTAVPGAVAPAAAIPTTIPGLLTSAGLPSTVSALVGVTGLPALLIDAGAKVAAGLVKDGMSKDKAAKTVADAMTNEIANQPPKTTPMPVTGLSTPIIIGIAVGGLALAGLIAWAVTRR